MEGRIAPILHLIIEHARRDSLPNLLRADRDLLKKFVLAMVRRTPESQRRISRAGNKDAFYEAAKARAKQAGLPLADRETLYTNPYILELKRKIESNVNARFASGLSNRERSETDRFCDETGFLVSRIVNSRQSFAIGSHGVAIVRARHSKDKVAGTWLPIAYDVALLVTAFPDREFLLRLDRSSAREQLVRRINLASSKLSHSIAGRSRKLVQSLMQRAIGI